MKSISQRVAQKLKEEGPSYDSSSGPKDRTRRSESPEQQQAKDVAYGGGGGIKGGEGGRVERKRVKKPGERVRMKATGGGNYEPVVQKKRKDAGETRTGKAGGAVLPKGERGAANVPLHKQSKEQRRAAYLAKKAAQARGEKAPTTYKERERTSAAATKLLRKDNPGKEKKPVSPDYKPQKASGYSRKERVALNRAGEKKLKGIMSDQERDKAKKKGETIGPQEIKRRVNKRMAN